MIIINVSWSYELWIALLGYGAIFPMENSVLKFLQLARHYQPLSHNGIRYLKSLQF